MSFVLFHARERVLVYIVTSINRRSVYKIFNEREKRSGLWIHSFFRPELLYNGEKRGGGEKDRDDLPIYCQRVYFTALDLLRPSLIVSAMMVESRRNVQSLLSASIFFNTKVHFQVDHVLARDRYVSVRKENLGTDRGG